MLKAEEQMELAILKKHGASIRGVCRGQRDGRATRFGGICAVAMRWPSVSLHRNGQRSLIRSRLTSSVG